MSVSDDGGKFDNNVQVPIQTTHLADNKRKQRHLAIHGRMRQNDCVVKCLHAPKGLAPSPHHHIFPVYEVVPSVYVYHCRISDFERRRYRERERGRVHELATAINRLVQRCGKGEREGETQIASCFDTVAT